MRSQGKKKQGGAKGFQIREGVCRTKEIGEKAQEKK